MADASFVLADLSTVIIAVLVGVTAIVYVYVNNALKSCKEDKEVKTENVEVSRKKKSAESSSGAPQKANKKKSSEKWNQGSNKQTFSHSWLLTSLKGHSGLVLDMDFSSDGKFLATCAEEDTTDDLDPGGGGGTSEQSSGSEGNKENSPEPGTNQRAGSGLSRRQKKNRVRRNDDSPVPKTHNNSANPKKTKPKPRRVNVTTASDGNLTNSRHVDALALRQHAKLNLVDGDLSAFLRHYVLNSDQLLALGYPVESAIYPGRAVIYKNQSTTASSFSSAITQCHGEHRSVAISSHFDVNAREFVPMSKQTADTSIYSYEGMEVNNTMYISSLVERDNPGMDYREIGVEWNAVEWNAGRRVKTEYHENYQLFDPCNSGQVSSEEASSSSSQEVSGSSDYCELSDGIVKHAALIVGSGKNTRKNGFKVPVVTSTVEKKWSGSDEKRCVRCSRGFFVTLDGEYLTQERCMYHWGKLQKVVETPTIVHTVYSCCKGNPDSRGCTAGKLHVWNGVGGGINGPFDSYVRTRPRKVAPADGNYGIYALDCEMCFTTRGLELTKVTVVGADGRLVYDCLVRPENYIIDYNTRFSGITARDLSKRGATKSLGDVQKDLTGFINSDTILIGHGLENDLRALRIIHGTVIDTSVAFPHYYGLPYRRSLKSLVGCFLKRDIQQDSSGHDSFEDARACIELMLWRIRKDFHSILG